MRNLGIVILVLLTFSCTRNSDNTANVLTDNPELQSLFEADQDDRINKHLDSKSLNYNDSIREARVYELLDSNKVQTANDYNNAALIFHHGEDSIAYGMAMRLMNKSIELDPSRDKWLLAVATDRYLLSKNQPQIYGTHFKRLEDQTIVREEMDSTKITDADRKECGVETLAEQREKLIRLNKKRIRELLDKGMSIDELIEFIENEDITDSAYDLSEGVIGRLGYQLMKQEKTEDAVKILRLTTQMYPGSYTAFDIYGESLLQLGDTVNAIIAYKKSLELEQDNENAKKVLSGINQD